MRQAATILLAGAVGLHCSGMVAPDGEAEPVTAPAPIDGELGRELTPDEDASRDRLPLRGPELERWQAMDRNLVPLAREDRIFTSTAYGPDGATYVVGTFEGTISFGTEELVSRGREDVFIVRRDAGHVTWARSMGSARSERAPTVTVNDGTVNVVGFTGGEMDCGAGPLPGWSSETFFFCVFGESDGRAEGGGAFPTGAP
jgi:hypothetical protein